MLSEIERDLPGYVGPSSEECCRDWVGRCAPADVLPQAEELGSWWSRNGQAEVDIVGLAKSRYVLLGSCKWDVKAPAGVLSRLLAHQEILGPRAAKARLAVFARGFAKDLVRQAEDLEVRLISAKELFS